MREAPQERRWLDVFYAAIGGLLDWTAFLGIIALFVIAYVTWNH